MISLVTTIKKWLFLSIVVTLILTGSERRAYADTSTYDNRSAVILSYQRIGEDHSPDTNIRLEQFQSHIQELTDGDYNVLPLPKIIDAIKHGKNLPPNSIAITFDGGYSSVLEHALPLLHEHELPYTIFVATNLLDNIPLHISKGDIKKLRRNKLVTWGIHPASYIRLSGEPKEEVRRQINNAKTAFRQITGKEPQYFSYPFGEYSLSYRDTIARSGFDAAFGLHSGAVSGNNDLYGLPRFTMTENYANISRFRLIANALPLPVTEIEPKDLRLTTDRPVIGFTVDKNLLENIEQLSCYISGQEQPEIEVIGSGRIEVRPAVPFTASRIRINCTLPGPTSEPGEPPRWRWFGLLMTMDEAD